MTFFERQRETTPSVSKVSPRANNSRFRSNGLLAGARRGAVLATALTLAACATPQTSRSTCDATRVQSFVGAIGTAQLGRQAMTRARAKTLRFIAPGAMVTMDYRSDRLNIRLDARNFITAIDCG